MADECACCGDLFTDSEPSRQSAADPDLCEWCATHIPYCCLCGAPVAPGHACVEEED